MYLHRIKLRSTYKISRVSVPVVIDDELKAGQAFEPARETQDCAMADGAAANMESIATDLATAVLRRRIFLVLGIS